MHAQIVVVTRLAAISFAACGSPPSVCSTPYVGPLPTAPLWGEIVPQEAGPLLLVTGAHDSMQCHVVLSDWTLGPQVCRMVGFDKNSSDGTPNGGAAGVMPTDQGFYLIADRDIVDVEGDKLLGTVTRIALSPPSAANYHVEALFPKPEPALVVWTSMGSLGTGTAGVGRLIGNEIDVVGDPFYTGPVTNLYEFLIAGGRDPFTGHAWLDSPDGVHALELAADGTVLRVVDHGVPVDPTAQVATYHWAPLPDGRWLGWNGLGWLCTFDPADRTDQHCVQLTPPAGSQHMIALKVLPFGDVLTAWYVGAPFDPGGSIFLGTWNGDTLVEGRSSDYSLEECTVPPS